MVAKWEVAMSIFKRNNREKGEKDQVSKKAKRGKDELILEEKINQEKMQINDSIKEIGRVYYELYRDDLHEKLVPICNMIDESNRIINLCEKQILLLQGVVICPSCKVRISSDSIFCNKCGAKIDSIEDDNANMMSERNDNIKIVQCHECGSDMPSDTSFCTHCGVKMKSV